MATATATAAVTTVVVTRNMRWCLRQKIKELLKHISTPLMTAGIATLPLAGEHPVSSAVVLCFRTQIFITRSDVVLVSGIHRGEPEIVGRYDSLGNPLEA